MRVTYILSFVTPERYQRFMGSESNLVSLWASVPTLTCISA